MQVERNCEDDELPQMLTPALAPFYPGAKEEVWRLLVCDDTTLYQIKKLSRKELG